MNNTTPDLKDLDILKSLIYDPHVTRCAARLHLTQSAISHALGRLRHYFKDPLFVRCKSGMEATPFLLSLEPLLCQLMRAADNVRLHNPGFEPGSSEKTFNIAISETVSSPLIPLLLEQIKSSAPYIHLNFCSAAPQDALPLLNTDQYDLYIGSISHAGDTIRTQILYREEFVCITRSQCSLIKKGVITQKDFLNAPHLKLSLQGYKPSYIDQQLANHGITRKASTTLPFYLLGFEVLLYEDSVMTAPKSMTNHVLRNHAKRRLYKTAPFPYPVSPLPIHQYWPAKHDKDKAHLWLRQHVKKTAQTVSRV